MSIRTDKLRVNLWNLKYGRHLQKSHSWFNLGIALSVGVPAILLGMIEVEIFSIGKLSAVFISALLFFSPWTIMYPLIKRERRLRKSVVSWIKGLDNTDFFQTT